jgi:hypothetical protein
MTEHVLLYVPRCHSMQKQALQRDCQGFAYAFELPLVRSSRDLVSCRHQVHQHEWSNRWLEMLG